ncbi:MAG: hypothetical protein JWM53_5268 [bacterium]|nr:hypothetical protein [bacterium]
MYTTIRLSFLASFPASFLALLLSGCALTPAAMRVADAASISDDDAERVVAAYRAPPDPSRAPRSLADAKAALHRDRIADFPAAYQYTVEHRAEPGALALGARLQLAWGEDQRTLAAILTHEIPGASERARAEIAGVRDALMREGDQHIADGMRLARALIASAPTDYRGYRAAADYYRIVGDWARFDETMLRLDVLNQHSSGYPLLGGQEQLARYHDRSRAAELFGLALARDPTLARAAVERLLARKSIRGAYDDYLKLEAISPDHQVVVWLGPLIERQHVDWIDSGSRHRASNEDRAQELGLRERWLDVDLDGRQRPRSGDE